LVKLADFLAWLESHRYEGGSEDEELTHIR
jgi:hypothetical protein